MKTGSGRFGAPRSATGQFLSSPQQKFVGGRLLCGACQQLLPLSRFIPSMRDPQKKQTICRECGRKRVFATRAKYKAKGLCECGQHPLDGQLKCLQCYWGLVHTLYGIGEKEYLEFLREQNGLCALCRRPPSKGRLFIDHDHETGKVRGLLCNRCNWTVGMISLGDYDLLKRAVEYINAHK